MAVFAHKSSRRSSLGDGMLGLQGFTPGAGTYKPVATDNDDSLDALNSSLFGIDSVPQSARGKRRVSLPQEDQNGMWSRGRALLQSIGFQTLMGAFIVLNAVVIGLETDLPNMHWLWDLLEHVLLVIFTTELVLRVCINGPSIYFDPREGDFLWNVFDVTVVGMGLIDALVSLVFGGMSAGGGETLFRMIRLLRILRIFRIVRFLKQLYLLAFGFIEAAQAVFWVTLLMACTLYVCSIILVRTVGRVSEEDPHSDLLHSHFGSIPTSMFTLFEIMANPEIEEYEGALERHPILGAFMIGFIIFGSFGMLALLTGVISESMFEKNQLRLEEERLERECKRKEMEKRCGDLFDKALTRYQTSIGKGPEDDSIPSHDIAPLIPMIAELFGEVGVNFISNDLEQLIDLMDSDGNGCVSKEEFCHGIISIAEGVRPVSIMEIHHIVSIAKMKLEKLLPVLSQMNMQSQEINDSKKFILERLQMVQDSMKDLHQTNNNLQEQSRELFAEKMSILESMGELRDVVSQVKGEVENSVHEQSRVMERMDSMDSISLPPQVNNQLEKYISPVANQLETYMSEVTHLRLSIQESLQSQPRRDTAYGLPTMAPTSLAEDGALVHQVRQCVISLSDLKTMVKDSMSDFSSQLHELKTNIAAAAVEGCLLKEAETSFPSPTSPVQHPARQLSAPPVHAELQQVLSGLGELKTFMKGRDDRSPFSLNMPRSPMKMQAEPSSSVTKQQLPGQPPVQMSEQIPQPLQYFSGIGELKCMVQEFSPSPTMAAAGNGGVSSASSDMSHVLWNTAPAAPSTSSTRTSLTAPVGESKQASVEAPSGSAEKLLPHPSHMQMSPLFQMRRLPTAGAVQTQVTAGGAVQTQAPAGTVGPPRDSMQADLPQQQLRPPLQHSSSMPLILNLPRSPQHRVPNFNGQ
mmetsp:Transcript_143311/g.260771  ORF Transcript_143311/g.260771 Transcript_143311/m.260771 type:complete len:918 (+) Transcript_143311:121-2874(+)